MPTATQNNRKAANLLAAAKASGKLEIVHVTPAKAGKAKAAPADPHALTPEKKARLAKSATKMAASPKASNQTAILSAADKAQVAAEAASRKNGKKVLAVTDLGGEEPAKAKARLNRELEQEAKATGAPRAFDVIATSGPCPTSANYHIVASAGGAQTLVPDHLFVGKVAEAAKTGLSYKAFKLTWDAAQKERPAKLATGLDGRNAPNAAKAVADHAAHSAGGKPKATLGAKLAGLAPAKNAAATRKEERKAARAAHAAPKATDDRKITIVDKSFSYGKPGSARNASWLACTKAKTVAAYAAAGGALKYLPRWVAAGAIKLG